MQGPFLAIFAMEPGERSANKTRTLKGVICTVPYCTGLIKIWLNFLLLLQLPMCGRQPLVALCLLLMKMRRQSAVTTVSSSLFQSPTVVRKNEPWHCSVLLSGLVRPLVLQDAIKVVERDANRQFAKFV